MFTSQESGKIPTVPSHPVFLRHRDGSIEEGQCEGSGEVPELVQHDPTGSPIKITCPGCHEGLFEVRQGLGFRPAPSIPAIVFAG